MHKADYVVNRSKDMKLAKDIRLLHELPQGGQVQTLPVEGPQSGEDARHPLGEAADRCEV